MSETMNNNKMPRRPATAYLLFQGEQDLKGIWNALSAKERKKYEALHAKDKIRYEKEKAKWEAAGGKDQHEVPKPKQTLSVYMFFSQAQKIGEKWRAAPEDVKDKYKAEAKKLLEQYKLDIAAYEEKYGPGALDAPDWPKRPLAPFMRFAQESHDQFAQVFPDLKTAGIGKKLGAAWNEMTDAERQEYVDAYEADHEKWLEEIAEYEAQYGDIAFIQKARAKARAEEAKEAEKKKQQLKRELQREKNRRLREKEVQKEKREKAKAKAIKDKEREKKHREEDREKALRRACVFYKQEHRPKLKKRFPDLTSAEINEQIEEKWNALVLSTQKSWVRRAQLAKEEKMADADGGEQAESAEVEDEQPPQPKKQKQTKKIAGKKRGRSDGEDEQQQTQQPNKKKQKKKVALQNDDDNAGEGVDDDANNAEAEDLTAVEKPAKKTKKTGPTAADLKKALAFYINQERPKLQKRDPNVKAAVVTKQIKDKWAALSEKTQNKYLRQAINAETESVENVEVDA